MKLHLGCGQVYLDGYVNIDYPLTEHTVQQSSVADEFADLTALRYKAGTIDEVRMHHVFEHFRRTVISAMLASWHSWLKPGGVVHLEMPDFDASALIVLDYKAKDRDRKVAIRHIFGSNEAPWAVHYDGWSEERLRELFKVFGFKVDTVEKTAYLATRNITIIGHKKNKTLSKAQMISDARAYLSGFNVDESDTENRLLDIWMTDFTDQLNKTLAK
jgi:predicted SAM-dependent methyltransferase